MPGYRESARALAARADRVRVQLRSPPPPRALIATASIALLVSLPVVLLPASANARGALIFAMLELAGLGLLVLDHVGVVRDLEVAAGTVRLLPHAWLGGGLELTSVWALELSVSADETRRLMAVTPEGEVTVLESPRPPEVAAALASVFSARHGVTAAERVLADGDPVHASWP